MSEQIELNTLRKIVVGGAWLLFGTFIWAGFFVFWKMDNSEIALPVVIIAGLVVLLIVLGLLTFMFSVLNLSDKNEALGLPSGSIRAVIALMLLVIFAIVAIFLYSDVSNNGRLQKIEHAKNADVTEFKKQLDVVFVLEEQPVVCGDKDTTCAAKAAAAKDGTPPGKLYTVFYRNQTSRTSEDLAKQLIVLLGTLVTAVSSFYFGSSSMAAAQSSLNKALAGSGGPNAEKVEPPVLPPDGKPYTLKIIGTNLAKVNAVKLNFKDKPPITGTGISPKDTEVTCTVVTRTAPDESGPWTVEVADGSNNYSKVRDAVTFKQA